MSDYSPGTDFSSKDSLSTGDPQKLIKGSDVDAEFDAISTAVNSKADSSITATGASVARSLDEHLRDRGLYPEDYGATGDGVADDTTPLTNWLTTCANNGIKARVRAGKTYLWDGITHTSAFTLIIEGAPADLPLFKGSQALADADGRMFRFERTSVDVTGLTLGADTNVNDRTITLGDTSSLSAGMVIQITSDKAWFHDDRGNQFRGELHKIDSVDSGTVITVEDPVRDVYKTTDTLNIQAWTPDKADIRNIRTSIPLPTGGADADSTACFQFRYTEDLTMENVECEGFTMAGILSQQGVYDRYYNIRARDSRGNTTNGYGVWCRSCLNPVIDGMKTYGIRRFSDFHSLTGTSNSAPTRDGRVRNYAAYGGGGYWPDTSEDNYGPGQHGPVENTVIEDGFVVSVKQGLKIRGRNTRIRGAGFLGEIDRAIDCSFGTGLKATDCWGERGDYPGKLDTFPDDQSATAYIANFINFGITQTTGDWDWTMPVVIHSNVMHLYTHFIEFVADNAVQNLHVEHNTIIASRITGTFVVYGADNPTDISRSTLGRNNIVDVTDGGLSEFSANLTLGKRDASTSAIKAGDNLWIATIPDDSFIRLNQPSVNLNGERLMLKMSNGAGSVAHLEIQNASATSIDLGGTTADITVTAAGSTLNGLTGADGDITLGLTSDILYVENRSGAERVFRFWFM